MFQSDAREPTRYGGCGACAGETDWGEQRSGVAMRVRSLPETGFVDLLEALL